MTAEPQIKQARIEVHCGVPGQTTEESNVRCSKVFITSYFRSCDHVTVELEGVNKAITVNGRELLQAIQNAMNCDGNW